jgi:hypothetical protein
MKTWVGLTEIKINHISLNRSTETDAVDFKILGVAFADTFDHVANETLAGAVHGTNPTVFVEACDKNFLAFSHNCNAFWESPVKCALGTFDQDTAVRSNFDGDFVRERDG